MPFNRYFAHLVSVYGIFAVLGVGSTGCGTSPYSFSIEQPEQSVPGIADGVRDPNSNDAPSIADGGTTPDTGASKPAAYLPLPTYTATVKSTVTLTPNKAGPVLNPNFVGFSYEKSRMTIPFFTAENQSLIRLYQLLGKGVVRIGANAVDKIRWNSGAGPSLTFAGVDRLAEFSRATGWKVIYGLNFKQNTTSQALSEAQYVSSKLGSNLYALQIGNEPDFYGLSFETFLNGSSTAAGWMDYYNTIHAAVPSAKFIGPSPFNLSTFMADFAAAAGDDIVQLTGHYYRANGAATTSTASLLLSQDPALASRLTSFNSLASRYAVRDGARIDECNTFYNGGALGISNGYASALWAVRYLYTLAENGIHGANFHGGGNSNGYTPLADNNFNNIIAVRPIFYGIHLFSKATDGQMMTTKYASPLSYFNAWGVSAPDGSLRTVLLNTDPNQVVGATLQWPSAFTQAQAIALTAPKQATLNATLTQSTGVTLGGSAVTPTGYWMPTSVYEVPVTKGTATIQVPPLSAYLLEVR